MLNGILYFLPEEILRMRVFFSVELEVLEKRERAH